MNLKKKLHVLTYIDGWNFIRIAFFAIRMTLVVAKHQWKQALNNGISSFSWIHLNRGKSTEIFSSFCFFFSGNDVLHAKIIYSVDETTWLYRWKWLNHDCMFHAWFHEWNRNERKEYTKKKFFFADVHTGFH